MSLEKMKRVSQLWNWLPTFRAAGETQQLSTAGEDLGVSTSAVSRAVRLLEEDLRHPLFDRVGRHVRLNEAGRELLNAVRNAMRVIDEAIIAVEESRFRGVVRIACDEPLLSLFVLPALPELATLRPEVLPRLSSTGGRDLTSSLLKGDIDLALCSRDLTTQGVQAEKLGAIYVREYVAEGHPLFTRDSTTGNDVRRDEVAAKELLSHPRVQLIDPNASATLLNAAEHGPALLVEDMPSLLSAVATGNYVGSLPETLAQSLTRKLKAVSGQRQRLPAFIAHRERLDLPTRADTVLDAIVNTARRGATG